MNATGAPLDWNEARDRTCQTWRRIRGGLENPDELWLLTEINAVCGLCKAARAESTLVVLTGGTKCDHCLFCEQFGSCREACAQMSERVVAHDWGALREMIDSFMASLRALEVPDSQRS